MAQLQQLVKPKRPPKAARYQTARITWIITSWIWTTIIIAFLIQFIPAAILVTSIQNTPGYYAIQFLSPPYSSASGDLEIGKLLALGGIGLFIGITLLAFLFKQILRDTGQNNFERILQAFEQDVISEKLDILSKQLFDDPQEQSILFNGLKQQLYNQSQAEARQRNILMNETVNIHKLLKQYQGTSHLSTLQDTLRQISQSQEKQSDAILLQLQHLSDLSEQEKKIHAATSTSLQHIAQSIDELPDKLDTIMQTAQWGNSSHPDLPTDTNKANNITQLPSSQSELGKNFADADTDADDNISSFS